MTAPPERTGLYTVGALSKIVGISADTLRYYDEIGLLKPARISDETGYRYYTDAQGAALARILELKEYGFSLAEIADILAGGETPEFLTGVYQSRYWRLLNEQRKLQGVIDKLYLKIKQREERLMNKTVIIADDADFMRSICTDLLSREGYIIAGEAKDGAEAAELYKSLSPDLILLDVVMPVCDGIFTLQKIREANPAARAVMLSAMGQARIVAESLIAGAQGFVVKPFQPEGLLSAVRDALQGAKVYNNDILHTIRERCINDPRSLSQTEIQEIMRCAQSGGGGLEKLEELIRRLKHGNPTDIEQKTQSAEAENNINILSMLNKIAQGQEEIKALLSRLIEN